MNNLQKIKSVETFSWKSSGDEKIVQSKHMDHLDHKAATKTATWETSGHYKL